MSELPNDEIDLVKLLQVIWDGKWLIAGFSALIILPTFAFLAFIYEPGKKASINLLPLSETQMNLYSGINSALPIPMTSAAFQDTFFREFFTGEIPGKIISENDRRILEFEGTEIKKNAAIADIVGSSFTIKISETAVLTPTVMSFEAGDAPEAQKILKAVVQALNNKTILSARKNIESVQSTQKRKLDFEILKTEIAIENILDDYETRTSARKAYLAEQLAIAETINIVENGFSDLLSKGSITGISGQDSLPFYMRGSKAIARELSLLKARRNSREHSLKHIDIYPELKAKLLALKTDPSIGNLENEFANSPFANDNQRIMNYNLNSITVVSTQSKLLILILVSILAGILATVFVMVRHFMSNQNTQTAH